MYSLILENWLWLNWFCIIPSKSRKKKLIICICRNFYGPGGSYTMFAGKECSRALALLSFKPQDINGNLEGLDESELTILEDWEYKFMEKYPKVGRLVPDNWF